MFRLIGPSRGNSAPNSSQMKNPSITNSARAINDSKSVKPFRARGMAWGAAGNRSLPNKLPPGPGARHWVESRRMPTRHVLYWMIASRRTRWNPALQLAVSRARELGLPLLVFEPLRAGHRWANARSHRFVMDGME